MVSWLVSTNCVISIGKISLRHPLNETLLRHATPKNLQQITHRRFYNKDKKSKHRLNLTKLLEDKLANLKDTMPKDEPHLKPLMDKRKLKRHQFNNQIASLIYWQVLGQGTRGGFRSLLLHTDTGKLMFNCSEGTQRLCGEYTAEKTLSNLEHIFITRKSWENLGGLPGMYLSIRAAGSPDVTVHGPKKTIELYHMLRPFSSNMDFDVHKCDSSDPPLDTKTIRVEHVDLAVPNNKSKVYPQTLEHSPWNSPYKSKAFLEHGRKPSPIDIDALNDMSKPYDETVTAYVITFKPLKGKLDSAKCRALGVPVGPVMGELKDGRDVILDDGTLIKSSDVVSAEGPPTNYVVLEVPSTYHLQALMSEPRLQPENLPHIQGIFHFTPPFIMRSKEYVEWMAKFPDHVQHVMINEGATGYESVDLMAYNQKLNMMHPLIFPGLSSDVLPSESEDKSHGTFSSLTGAATSNLESPISALKKLLPKEKLVYQAKLDQKYSVRPDKGLIEDSLKVYDAKEVTLEMTGVPEVSAMIAQIQDEVKGIAEADDSYPKVTFLGTGSAVPSKYRNVSAILVESRPDNFIMLDCGDGTLSQLHRRFGVRKAQDIIKNLKAIYISHLHVDHHMGFIGLVSYRKSLYEDEKSTPPLYVMAPSRMSEYLLPYHCKFESILESLVQVKNEHLLPSPSECGKNNWPPVKGGTTYQQIAPNVFNSLREDCGLENVEVRKALHCAFSFQVALTFSEGFKLVYTGDTRPTEDLIELGKAGGKQTDLLIHEATAEHAMIVDCTIKKHSTFVEAIEDGKKMDAKFTLLTHFSQRYGKAPLLDEIEGHENVGVAWDHMTVSPKTWPLIPKVYPIMKEVFSEEFNDMREKREQYLEKKETQDDKWDSDVELQVHRKKKRRKFSSGLL